MSHKVHKANTSEEKEVYLLKIYRRSLDPAESLVGILEEISGKKKMVFKTEEELLRWLREPE